MSLNRSKITAFSLMLLGLSVGACEERDNVWNTTTFNAMILPLKNAAAVVDSAAERVLVLQANSDLSLSADSVPIGKNVPSRGVALTADGSRLAMLCRGDIPRRTVKDQGPALFLLGGEQPGLQARYELSDPLSSMTMDPASRYVIISASDDDSSFVSNPNELIITDLTRPPGANNPTSLTLRSFGGRPQRLDFTEPLDLPSGTKRLLIAQTDRDIALLDLEDPTQSEITVRLTSGTTQLSPAGLAVSNGDPERNDDARLAIRLANSPEVIIVDLLPPSGEAAENNAPFRPVPNIIGVGGVVSDLAFVRTDGGLRLATMVPTTRSVVLIEPTTGTTTTLALSSSFQRITLVTEEAQQPGETALLWSTTQSTIGFLSLEKTTGKPYKSIEELPLPEPIQDVLPVPTPFAYRKILVSPSGRNFYVLDLLTRRISPLASNGARLMVSPNGQQAWAFSEGGKDLASINLENAHPQNLLLPYTIAGITDITRKDGGRALIAFHRTAGLSATIFDAAAPSLITSREAAALSLEALP